MLPSSLPLLTTERLLLRQLQPADDIAIFALRSNQQVNTFIQRPLAEDIIDAQYFIQSINEGIAHKNWFYWAIIIKENGQLIGTICLWHIAPDLSTAEIGYELHPAYQGLGFMNEAMQTIIQYGLHTLHVKTLEAYTQPQNTRSVKLLEKNNFAIDLTNNNTGNNKEIRFVLQQLVS